MQLNHYNTNFQHKTFPITVVCDNVTNAPNLGSLFRICDAFGVEQLMLCGKHIPLGRKMAKTSRATENVVKYSTYENSIEVITELKLNNYHVIALEITETSQSIYNFNVPINQSIVLIVGDENFGVSEDVLKLCDAIVHIPMYGQNSSMNVVQATNIGLYEITKQLI
ncbi:MAG: RNA methyltransferase [Bacteroidetes bacterium]|nr:MAG: RNA methyltransferase [Bacteroidota bacterium]